MDRQTIEALAHFCVAQRTAFDADAWHARAAVDGAAVYLAARYLSMTSWYGYEEELEKIAAPTQGITGADTDFDLEYFSAKVRFGVALSRHHPAPRGDRRRQPIAAANVQAKLFEGE